MLVSGGIYLTGVGVAEKQLRKEVYKDYLKTAKATSRATSSPSGSGDGKKADGGAAECSKDDFKALVKAELQSSSKLEMTKDGNVRICAKQ